MSKALKVIGTIAGAVALVATGVGAFAGAAFAASATGATVAAVATYAGLVAGVAGIGAALLQKAPPARGSVSQVVIQADAPSPYVMGEGLFAGIVRHDTAYGPTLNKVPNPYRFIAALYCVAGPIHSITPYVDQGPVSSWYSGFLYTDTQLGATPEATALSPQWSGAPGWGASSKLSGKAAIGWSFKFDKDGKRFASGLPAISAYGKWVKVYDPRKDSTFPGGSGSHRIGVESTYEWSENPALHAGTYAFGRYQNAKRVMGVGLPKEAINWNAISGWANVCDLNEWSIFGVVYEPGDRWANMRDICFAGGAEPVFSGGVLSFRYSAPKVPLDTITEADLIDDNASVTAMASWRDRINSVVPKYRSPAHNWELIPASPVTVSSYVTEDGEIKSEEIPFNFVKKADQAEQLAAYRLVDGRELQPITITCGPRLFAYRPGECLHLTLPSLSLDTDAVILRRDFDPARMTVTFTLIGETPEKHDFALGKTGTAPATPALKQTGEERDELSSTVVIGVDGAPGVDGVDGAPGVDGVDGAPGAPATSAYLTNESIQLFAYANGNVVSYSGASGDFKVFAGSTDISASFVLSTQANPQSLTIGYSGRTYTVTGGFDTGEDTASVTIRATGSGVYAGVAFEKVLSLSKAKGGYEIVGSLPTTDLFSGRVVFNEVDDKLYRYTGVAWTAAVPAIDIDGTIDYQQIGNGAVRVQHLLITPNNFNPDPQFRDQNLWIQDDEVAGVGDGKLDSTSVGWFTEEFANPQSLGVPAIMGNRWIQLWSGRSGQTNSGRFVLYAANGLNNKFNVYSGQVLELKAAIWNASNQSVFVAVQFFNSSDGYLGELRVGVVANAVNLEAAQITAPNNSAYGRVVIYNNGGSTYFGRAYVSNISIRDTAGASMIVDGGILARHVAAEQITTDKLGAGVVTAAKVAASNVITLSAQINDAVITNAKIANLAVDTLKIAGNAVTLGVSAFSAGEVTLPMSGAWQDIQSIVISTDGSPIIILAQASIFGDGGPATSVPRILRNGSEIRLGTNRSGNDFVASDAILMIADTPGAGTHTYTLQAAYTSGIYAGIATNRFLFALNTKR